MKIVKHGKSIETTKQFGLPESCVQFLGLYLLAATILYVIPKTSIQGTLLLIAYLGGATAITYLNKHAGWEFLFPVAFALLIILAAYLQNSGLKSILSFK